MPGNFGRLKTFANRSLLAEDADPVTVRCSSHFYIIKMSNIVKDIILNAIDTLRRRKTRPNLANICQILDRTHRFTELEIRDYLETLVNTEAVIKVSFKKNVSYRNAEKWPGRINYRLKKQKEANTKEISNMIYSCVMSVIEHNQLFYGPADSRGASFCSIEARLFKALPQVKFNRKALQTALDHEVASGGSLFRLDNGNYWPIVRINTEPLPQSTDQISEDNNENESDSSMSCDSSEFDYKSETCQRVMPKLVKQVDHVQQSQLVQSKHCKSPAKRNKFSQPLSSTGNNANIFEFPAKIQARPLSQRKRFKKVHGPDFVETSSLPSLDCIEDLQNEEDAIKCDYCLMPASSNPSGEREPLLICKDCNAKAHPSCMEYSPELARKSRLYSWQCMDCKICTVCEDAEDGECMLFCDSCDKGYHMSCHKPKIVEKPIGKWVCYQCVDQPQQKSSSNKSPSTSACRSKAIDQEKGVEDSVPNELSGLPTPCDSSVSDLESNDSETKAPTSPFETKDSNGTINKMEGYPQLIPDAKDWTMEDVEKFLISINFPEQGKIFREQEIDGKSLLLMKRSDVLTGMSLRLGPALKIYNHIKRLQTGTIEGKVYIENNS